MSVGQLKVFLGISPGVGKTYLMLQEAQKKLKEGVKVAAGNINTHGRKEIEELLQGIPVIAEKKITYKDVIFKELDLEGVLQAKPSLILIDELAHTNIPGSKHNKRWQDVVEILNAGINVYTTLNIQHVESQKDVVEGLLGIPVQETVPDFIIEKVAEIEFIEISPNVLLERLKEGKIYTADQSAAAINNFFQEKNLETLSEIATRFRDEKIESDYRGVLGKGWKSPERLMLAMSTIFDSEQLIRSAKRLSLDLDASWITVYLDSGAILSDQDQINLNKHLNLARELGAEVLIVHDLDIFAAIQRIAKQKEITRLMVGRSHRKKFNFKRLFNGSFFDPLERENRYIDVLIHRDKYSHLKKSILPELSIPWKSFFTTLIFFAAVTLLGFLIDPIFGYKSFGFIFLPGILVLSFFVCRGTIILASILSALCWKLLFIPPIFTFKFSDYEDFTLLIIYFIVAVITGSWISRMTEKGKFLEEREEKIENLYEVAREIANANDFQTLRYNVNKKLEKIFLGNFDILIKNQDNELNLESKQPFLLEEKEKTTARWVFQHGKVAGWSTNTLPSANGLYFPIKVAKLTLGVLVYFPKKETPLLMEEIDFLQTVAQQLGIYLRRYFCD